MQTEGRMEKRTEIQSEVTKLIVAFRNSANARTKVSSLCYTTAIGKEDNSSVSICLPLQF